MNLRLLLLALVLCVGTSLPLSAEPGDAASTRPFAFSGNAYDLLQFISYARNGQCAIDPATLETLVKTEISLPVATTQSNAEILDHSLKPAGFVVQELALTSTVRVAFVTTTDGWTYFQAITAMKRGNLQVMYNLLTSVKDDQTDFGAHCIVLKKALLAIAERNQQMSRLEAQIQVSLDSFERYKTELKMAQMVASRSHNSDPQDNNTTLAKGRYDKAVADVQASFDALDELYDKTIESNAIIADAYEAAYAARYTSEAAFLYEHLYDSFARFRTLLGSMQQEGLLKSEKNLGEVPPDVIEQLASLRETMTAAQADLATATEALAAHDWDRAREFYGRAYWGDRSLPLARAGIGYCDLQRSADGLRAMLDVADPEALATQIQQIEKEFRERQQLGMLRAMVARRTQKPLPPPRPPITKIGSVNGMAVVRGKGELFPLSVRIDAITSLPVAEKKEPQSYWETTTISEIKKRDYPVSFGDYGQKDVYMFLAATEAYKWLKGVDDALTGRIGLQVEFQELVAGKGGDSAGVTIATAAYSRLRQVPVRQDVAMTGSVHGDGVVKAVGMVDVKVAHAAVSPGIELAIVPEENEADLSLLSIEDLCRITLITAHDMRTYLKYALSPGEKATDEQRQAEATIARLHDAQAHLLSGETTAALEILVSLADAPPEIYNVRRLLDLLLAKQMADGKLAAARELRQQMDDALTRQALAAPVQDFQIPTATTTLPASILAKANQAEEPLTAAPSPASQVTADSKPQPSPQLPVNLGSVGPDRIDWDALPYSGFNGAFGALVGEPAKIEKMELIIKSQSVRTHTEFTDPATFEFDVSLDERAAESGHFEVLFKRPNEPVNTHGETIFTVGICYNSSDPLGTVMINGGPRYLVTHRNKIERSFTLQPHHWYHLTLEFDHNKLRYEIDGQIYEGPTVALPAHYQIQFDAGSLLNIWRVRNITSH